MVLYHLAALGKTYVLTKLKFLSGASLNSSLQYPFWHLSISKCEFLVSPMPSPLSPSQPYEWELHHVIWKYLWNCSWCLPLIYPLHLIQILSICPLNTPWILPFLISSTPATLAHLESLQEPLAGLSLPPIVLTFLSMQQPESSTIVHIIHVIKTFQWLSISLKTKTKVLNVCKTNHDLGAC